MEGTSGLRAVIEGEATLRSIDTPILATFAANDENVPSAESARTLETIRAERGGIIEIVVYPGRKHSMFRWGDILNGGYPPDYFSSLRTWVREHGGAGT